MRRERAEKIAADLLLMPTLADVANKNGISLTTLYKWRREESFQTVLSEQKARLFGDASARLQAYALEAVDVLMQIIRNPAALDANKISAIRILLDGARAANERDDLLPKLEELERQVQLMEERNI